ncbi:Nn.00g008890.m01.CDS01 [Neocucurbitaria sp. VM-36]
MSTNIGLAFESAMATKTTTLPRPPLCQRQCRIRVTLALLLSLIIILFSNYYYSHHPVTTSDSNTVQPLTLTPIPSPPPKQQLSIRIAKATIHYPRSNTLFNTSLALHASHNARFGYEMHILRTHIVKGALNKLLWLQQLIVAELMKREEERMEWICYFDHDVLVWNEQIPLQTYLPPVGGDWETFKALAMIGWKDEREELSTAVMFVRVSAVAVRILTLAMARVVEDVDGEDDKAGGDVVGKALQCVLEREEYRDKVVYQAAAWYDHHGLLTSESGLFMQVHRGQSLPLRLREMKYALGVIEYAKEHPNMSKHRAAFPRPDEVQRFWDVVIEARKTLGEAKDRSHTVEVGEWEDQVREVKELVEIRAWDTEELIRRVRVLQEQLGIRKEM